ncbi:MAG: phage integrase family protein, partial [Anaerolineales bacterium]
MTRSTGRRKHHFKNVQPRDPAVKPFGEWLGANRSFYANFRTWLRDGGYGDSVLNIYGTAARLALGWLDMPYWQIELQDDLDKVREYIGKRYKSRATRQSYLKGIAKLEEYLRFRCHRPKPEKRVSWQTFVGPLPDWLAKDVRSYMSHRSRTWLPEAQYRAVSTLLSHLTLFLRWAAGQAELSQLADLTPNLWFDYVDERLAAGLKPVTLNGQLREVLSFLRFFADSGRELCRRMMRVEPLNEASRLPRDVSLDRLRVLLAEVERSACDDHAGILRMGIMDRAWLLLMLHSGLRVGEVRRLRLSDLDQERRRVRIEQSKGLKDRIVCLSEATVRALEAWLDVRGPAGSDHVFIYRHMPLSVTYCATRLRTYGKRCGVVVTPHQLRHSCATLLLNAGAPILTVQAILGHKHVDTTMAADYYRAMEEVERRMEPQREAEASPRTGWQLLTLVDALQARSLNSTQRQALHELRARIAVWCQATIRNGHRRQL